MAAALDVANALLGHIGVGVRVSHLRECVSSLFVALFEGLLRIRLDGVKRNAMDRDDKIHNVDLVLRAFEAKVLGGRESLSHISASKVVDGSEDVISNLLFLFGDLDAAITASTNPIEDSTIQESKEVHVENYHSPKKRKPVVAFSPVKTINRASGSAETKLPATIYANASSSTTRTTTKPKVPIPTKLNDESSTTESSTSKETSLGQKKRREDGFLHVVDDVEHYILARAREKIDSELNSSVEGARIAARRGNRNETTIRFNLKPSSTPRQSALKILPTDTPHTRALKLRQQRLIAAKNEARARTESSNRILRQSLANASGNPSSTRQSKSTLDPPPKRRKKTRAPSETINFVDNHSERRWWEGRGLFQFPSQNENQSEIDPNENNEGGFSIQSDTNLSSISPPEGFVGLDDSAADEIYSTQSLASQSDRSANIDSFEYMESDFENSVESVSNQFDDEENAYQNPSNMTITEQNFSLFEKMIKEELCVKEVPNAIKTKAWNNQIQDRKRALNSRLHQRKRNMHAEVLAFSDVRPIQALRKDVERTARTQQVKREREAQRQTKASLTNQNRRVIKMEQRLADAERDVESILQRRRMREKELSRQLYESYLSSQRSYIGELSRMDRDQRRAKMEAEKIKRESKESYVKDQIRLLEEELKEAKREEELIAKAHAEEMRKLIREQKSKAKDDIQRIKSKLTIDDNDFELQRAAAINAARNMRFGIQNK